MLIAYGVSGVAPDTDVSRLRHVAVDSATKAPLRLNSGAIQPIPDDIASSQAERFELAREQLLSLCDPWSRNAPAFIDGYFAFVRGRLEQNRDEVEDRLRDFGRVFEVEDYLFSAWLPLPRAALPVALAGEPEKLVECDFCFWAGASAIAIYLDTGNQTASRRRDVANLHAAGIEVRTVGPQIWADASTREGTFPPELSMFWRAQPLPKGLSSNGDFVRSAAFARAQDAARSP
jgi:hypothetical protein